MTFKNKFILFSKYIIGLGIIFFILESVHRNLSDIRTTNFHLSILFVFLSVFFLLMSLLFQLSIWYLITKKNSFNMKYLESISLRLNAEFGKYIPGRIALYGILIYAYKKKNISAEQVVFCSLNEAIASLTGSVLFVLIGSVFINIGTVIHSGIIKVMILLLAIGLLLPQPQRFLFKLLSKITKFKDLGKNQIYSERLLFALLFFMNWAIYGLSFFFLIKAFFFVEFNKLIFIAVVFCLSTFIGFLAFIVPAGLGVREGTLTILLKQIIPLGAASFISIFSRIWLMIGEVVLLLFLFLVKIMNVRLKIAKKRNHCFNKKYSRSIFSKKDGPL